MKISDNTSVAMPIKNMIGIVVGILFDDFFGVISGLGRVMTQFGDAGFAGILALMIIVMWYEKK